jgi:hypothetical protein
LLERFWIRQNPPRPAGIDPRLQRTRVRDPQAIVCRPSAPVASPSVFDHATNQLVDEVVALAAQPGTGEVSGQPRHTLEMVALFDRCRGLFGAVRFLAQHGFGQEALILTRPMFTEALMLLEVASADETRRVELAIGYALATGASLEGIWREAQVRGHDVSEQMAAAAKERESLERYARERNARTRQWRVNEKELADKHVGGEGYLDFRMAHHFVHGSTFAAAQRYTPHGDVVRVGGPAASQEDWARVAVLSASQSMVFAVRGICGILGWPEPRAVPDLLTRLDQLADDSRPGD